jgi:hypothetical protein
MENKLVRVSDVYLNAYLRAENYSCVDVTVERIDGRRTVIFLYNYSKDLENAIQNFRDSDFMRGFIREYLYTKRQITKALQSE